ncbi:p450 domain-containing protein [Cephalotus follicularis]|uniref:p450 domain-containing protein n=1 Tax=Cephalotus follicularis TaxID=3775 RepID=A0A1Q3DIJ5_CEPFO|nr:p450 domain-containing protein [Cephalotus follicularis]
MKEVVCDQDKIFGNRDTLVAALITTYGCIDIVFSPYGPYWKLNVGAMHKDPDLWGNPLEFRPERFLNDPNLFDYRGNNLHYLPFGSGRRICTGIPLAEKMLMHVVASLMHCFKWEFPPGQALDFFDKFGIVVKKKESIGCYTNS